MSDRPTSPILTGKGHSGASTSYGLFQIEFNDDGSLPGINPDWRVINNTLWGYAHEAIRITGNSPRGSLLIANNILNGSGQSAIGVNYLAPGSNPNISVENNGWFNNLNGDAIGLSSVPAAVSDPHFSDTTVTEPNLPGEAVEQGFQLSPTSTDYIDAGNTQIWIDLNLPDSLDVDKTARIKNGQIDLGAQEF